MNGTTNHWAQSLVLQPETTGRYVEYFLQVVHHYHKRKRNRNWDVAAFMRVLIKVVDVSNAAYGLDNVRARHPSRCFYIMTRASTRHRPAVHPLTLYPCTCHLSLLSLSLSFSLSLSQHTLTHPRHSLTQAPNSAPPQPAQLRSHSSPVVTTAVVAETSSAAATPLTPFPSTRRLASTLRAPSNAHVISATPTTAPGVRAVTLAPTASPAKAAMRPLSLSVYPAKAERVMLLSSPLAPSPRVSAAPGTGAPSSWE